MKDALGGVQSVLVVGGTSEIALATVRRLAAGRTRRVVLAGRDPAGLAAAAASLPAGMQAEVAVVDADDLPSHQDFVDEVFKRHGDFDVVLVAVGVLGRAQEAEQDLSCAQAILRTNFLGAGSLALACASKLRAQGHGTLVVLSSVAGERVRRANFVYGASKAGLDALAQGIGHMLAPTGASVLVVRPGFVRTRMTAGLPSPPLATTPEAVAEAIVRGLARGAEMIWVPPLLRWVMAVVRHLPTPIFRRLPF